MKMWWLMMQTSWLFVSVSWKKYNLSHLATECGLSAADQEQSVILWCVRTASQPADEDVTVTHSLAIRPCVGGLMLHSSAVFNRPSSSFHAISLQNNPHQCLKGHAYTLLAQVIFTRYTIAWCLRYRVNITVNITRKTWLGRYLTWTIYFKNISG